MAGHKRAAELEAEIKRLTTENESLNHKNTKLEARNDKLKQSLDETTKICSEQRQKLLEANKRADNAEHQLASMREIPEADVTVSRLRRELSQTNKRMSEFRKRLTGCQERLVVIEEVTKVKRTRELHEEDYYNMFAEENHDDPIYQNLISDSTQVQPPGGKITVCCILFLFNSNIACHKSRTCLIRIAYFPIRPP